MGTKVKGNSRGRFWHLTIAFLSCVHIKNIFSSFTDKTKDSDIMFFMRNPKSVKMLQDTPLGLTMGASSFDWYAKSLLILITVAAWRTHWQVWQNGGAANRFGDVGKIDDVTALGEGCTGFILVVERRRGGRSFDLKSQLATKLQVRQDS
jgi:hypothetical protein